MERCAAFIPSPVPHQCSRKAVVDGRWCKFHAPGSVARRHEARVKAWRAAVLSTTGANR